MAKVAIVYHSGYGHTAKVADHVRIGAASADVAEVALCKADDLTSPETGPWDELAAADPIVFGAPTYMGSVSAVFKQFQDASSKPWFAQVWKDKIAAGFTNSGSLSGDKSETLSQFATLAAQHGMIWVGTGMMPGYNASTKASGAVHNRLSYFLGLGVQSLTDKPAEETPDRFDLETA